MAGNGREQQQLICMLENDCHAAQLIRKNGIHQIQLDNAQAKLGVFYRRGTVETNLFTWRFLGDEYAKTTIPFFQGGSSAPKCNTHDPRNKSLEPFCYQFNELVI